jgi:hypothetical protein
VYAASSAALAVLEVRVHLDLAPDLIPGDYILLEIDLDDLRVETVMDLPADPVAFGDAWLAAGKTPVLQIPSVIVPESPNLLLNPLHSDAIVARILRRWPFAFDRRLWLPL